jgi:hypothetical protein
MSFNVVSLVVTLFLALLACASPTNMSEIAVPLARVITKCTVSGTAALTFDDGPYEYIEVSHSIIKLFWTILSISVPVPGDLKSVDRRRWEGNVLLQWRQL